MAVTLKHKGTMYHKAKKRYNLHTKIVPNLRGYGARAQNQKSCYLLRGSQTVITHSDYLTWAGPPLELILACAPAKRAIGTRYGEQDT